MASLSSSVGDIIYEGVLSGSEALDLDKLRNEAIERADSDAENAVIYYSHAQDILSEYSSDEPDESEVAGMMGGGASCGDWRKVMTMAAYLTARAVIERKVDEDIEALKDAIEAAETEGFEATAIHGSCLYGWAPHRGEVDMGEGTLHDWPALEGGPDRYLLSVKLDDCTVWIELSKEASEESGAA